jgi:hypothetical protein
MSTLELEVADAIREDAERAFAKISNDANRLSELDDDDLLAVATQVKTALPVVETLLVARCGGIDRANEVLAQVFALPQAKLVKLVRLGNIARVGGRQLTARQLAASVVDINTGVGAVTVEQQRRTALRAGAMN